MTQVPFDAVVSLEDLKLERRDSGPGIGGDAAKLAGRLGLTGLGATYYEVRPGEADAHMHVHYLEDEMTIVLEGEGTYRFGAESHPVKAGDVLSAPAGRRDWAHQLVNTGTGVLRYLCIANHVDTNIVELPEQGVLRITDRTGGAPRREFAVDRAPRPEGSGS